MKHELTPPPMQMPVSADWGSHSGYDVVSAVIMNHVPVIIGYVSFFIILLAPYVYTYYIRYIRKPSNEPAEVGERTVSLPWFALRRGEEDIEEAAADKEKLAAIEAAAAMARAKTGETKQDVNNLELEADSIVNDARKAKALRLIGEICNEYGDFAKAEELYTKSMKTGIRAKKEGAISALDFSMLLESRGEIKQALDFARRALLLFEQAGMSDETDNVTNRIKSLKSRA